MIGKIFILLLFLIIVVSIWYATLPPFEGPTIDLCHIEDHPNCGRPVKGFLTGDDL